jgi:hypothetical protein
MSEAEEELQAILHEFKANLRPEKSFIRRALEGILLAFLFAMSAGVAGSSFAFVWTKALNFDEELKKATKEIKFTQKGYGDELDRQRLEDINLSKQNEKTYDRTVQNKNKADNNTNRIAHLESLMGPMLHSEMPINMDIYNEAAEYNEDSEIMPDNTDPKPKEKKSKLSPIEEETKKDIDNFQMRQYSIPSAEEKLKTYRKNGK